MKELISRKLRVARVSLRLSQTNVADQANYNQSGVSAIESGNFTFLPLEYLAYWASKGINLTALCDPTVTEDQFKEICEGKLPTSYVKPGPCKQCEEKDRLLADKQEMLRGKDETIASKNELIQALRDKITGKTDGL